MVLRQRNQPGFAALFETVTLASNIHRRRMVQQSIKDRRGDDGIAEDGTPLAIALVRRQNDAAAFVPRADELEENRRAEIVEWQVSHLIDHQDLRCKIDAQPHPETSRLTHVS